MAGSGDPVAARGIVAAQIYQGGHVDLYVDAQDVASGRLLLRLAAKENMSLWPAGTPIGMTFSADRAIPFRPGTNH